MLKRLDKKGQVEWGTLIPGLIALTVLIVVILGIFWFVNRAGGVGENIPNNIEIIKSACQVSASPAFVESYCNQIREIGKNKYVTCDYAYSNEKIDIEGAEQMAASCNNQVPTQNQRIINECNTLNNPKININGKLCSEWIKG